MRKNGKTNSGQGGQGRARRWIALAARWSAALLSAYVPLVEQLPPLVPALLVNVLALLAGVHALLPIDGAPRAVPTGGTTVPVCRFDSRRRRMTGTSPRPGTGARR
ncbi:hypothetical protein ACFW6Q_17660 [Streptomyces sp. NPDC058737]|uniref:hypothetical protein n=1 Tax=Streptomyces sp. NPDC058737 TaxID=3346617 RepID=UPI0036B61ABD